MFFNTTTRIDILAVQKAMTSSDPLMKCIIYHSVILTDLTLILRSTQLHNITGLTSLCAAAAKLILIHKWVKLVVV
jgi:hypothetical protein